jgi:hypothetical protein
VALADLAVRGRATGVWQGSPSVIANGKWYEDNFYATLASRKVWLPGTSMVTHEFGGPITWDIVAIPQAAPPPCDQPQPTGYDADSCRYVNALFKELEKKDPAAARMAREQARRGRDVWFKGTFAGRSRSVSGDHRARPPR